MSDLGYTTRTEGRFIYVTIAEIERKHSEWAKIWGVTAPCVAARLRSGFVLAKLQAGRTANRIGGVRSPSRQISQFQPNPSVDAQAVASHWFKTPVPRVGR